MAMASHVGVTLDRIQQKIERQTAEREIERLAFYDPLTLLPNRRLLLDRIEHALAASRRHSVYSAVYFIDLDNFKQLNDTLGHEVGDRLLIEVARRLSECLREGDTVARFGGDEFIVLIEDLSNSMEDAASYSKDIGEKFLSVLATPYRLGNAIHHASASIGLTLFAGSAESVDELMRQADIAMYQAKSAGRNNMRFFDPQMQAAITAKASLESALRLGIERQEFLLFYQPFVSSAGVVTGAEALLRWNRPGDGLVSPAKFVAFAEETGLILPIWNFVLDTVCRLLASWADDPFLGSLKISVNVGNVEFRQPDFVDKVRLALETAGASASRLILELTESMVIHDLAGTIAKMSRLKKLGVGFSMDDFGTGYSSLAYLAQFPLDEIKVDQSFVRNLATNPTDAAVVQSIITLGNSLSLNVVAEGVESDMQLQFLKTHGCPSYQGYLFARPMPTEQFVEFVYSSQGRV